MPSVALCRGERDNEDIPSACRTVVSRFPMSSPVLSQKNSLSAKWLLRGGWIFSIIAGPLFVVAIFCVWGNAKDDPSLPLGSTGLNLLQTGYVALGVGLVVIVVLAARAIARGAVSRGIFMLVGAPLVGGLIGAAGEFFVFAIYTRYHVEWEKMDNQPGKADQSNPRMTETP